MNAGNAGPRATRFHWMNSRHRAAQESAIFRLPPGVDDGRPTLANDIIVPAPHRRLDGFAHRGHMFEAVVVFRRLVGPGAAKRPDRCWRGVKDIDVEFLGDTPWTPCVGIGGKPFVDDRGGGEGQWPVDNIRMTG